MTDLDPAERIARTPIAGALATLDSQLSMGEAAEVILAAIRDAGLSLYDPDERCGECNDRREEHGEWSADLSHTFS